MTTDSVTSPEKGGKKAKRRKGARGVVSIDIERCKGCGYCVEFCPMGVLVMSGKFNSMGYHYPEVVKAWECTGCDLCGMYCPDFAIYSGRVSDAGSTKE